MNDNNKDHSNNDLTDDNMYNNIDQDNIDWEQTNQNSLYTLAKKKLQLSSDLEDLDWNSTDNHNGELIIAYDNKVGYKTLRPRAFYVLYVKPNEKGNGHLIYRLSTDQIVVTKDYQTIPVPEYLVDTTCKSDPYENKSQVNDVDMIISIVHDDQSNNYDNNDRTSFNNEGQYLQETNEVLGSSLLTSL